MKAKLLYLVLWLLAISSTLAKGQANPVSTKGMVKVESNTFIMGLDSLMLKNAMLKFNQPASYFAQEFPSFRVTVAAYYIDKYEVTNAQFKEFIDANPQWSKSNISDSLHNGNYLKHWDGNNYPKKLKKCPVVYVSWYAANAYASWKSKRLPMEAEWEYSAKGAQKTAEYTWEDTLINTTKANYLNSGFEQVINVGNYKPNKAGLYDMAGNAAELCLDTWRPNAYVEKAEHKKVPYKNLPIDKNKAVLKGGSWQSPAVDLRTTSRQAITKTNCSASVGFRCAMSAPKQVIK